MSINSKIQRADQRILRLAMFQDGLWDVMLGLTFVLLSLYPVLRRALGPSLNLLAFAIELAAVIGGISLLRQRLTASRLGQVRLGASQRARLRHIRLTGAGLMLFTAFVFTLASLGRLGTPIPAEAAGWLAAFEMDILFAALIILFFSLMGVVLGLGRLYLYGWLLGLGNLASTVLAVTRGIAFLYPLALAGALIVLIGLTCLTGFLHSYPEQLGQG
jgi:hypothetical protein